MKKKMIRVKPIGLTLLNTDHFLLQAVKRGVNDLSLIAQLMVELLKSQPGQEVEITNGTTTIVAMLESDRTAKLVTCWNGKRG